MKVWAEVFLGPLYDLLVIGQGAGFMNRSAFRSYFGARWWLPRLGRIPSGLKIHRGIGIGDAPVELEKPESPPQSGRRCSLTSHSATPNRLSGKPSRSMASGGALGCLRDGGLRLWSCSSDASPPIINFHVRVSRIGRTMILRSAYA